MPLRRPFRAQGRSAEVAAAEPQTAGERRKEKGERPAGLDESEVRAHVLHLKEQRAYSPSSIRTVVAALRVYYGLHLGREGKLFDLVRSPDRQRLPQVLAAHARSMVRCIT